MPVSYKHSALIDWQRSNKIYHFRNQNPENTQRNKVPSNGSPSNRTAILAFTTHWDHAAGGAANSMGCVAYRGDILSMGVMLPGSLVRCAIRGQRQSPLAVHGRAEDLRRGHGLQQAIQFTVQRLTVEEFLLV
jgi:hypothetical protein